MLTPLDDIYYRALNIYESKMLKVRRYIYEIYFMAMHMAWLSYFKIDIKTVLSKQNIRYSDEVKININAPE